MGTNKISEIQCKYKNTMRVVKLWKNLPREVVEYLFLKIFKTLLDMVLGNLPLLSMLEQGGWTRRS